MSYRLIESKIIIAAFMLLALFPLTSQAKSEISLDSDNDGLSDAYERQLGTEPYLADTDGDGINDGIEVGNDLNNPLDTDGDHRINALDYDDDNDGLPSILETKNDTDFDGMPNYLDPDSDNDGVIDGIEAGMLKKDENHDFIDDAFNVRVNSEDKNGDSITDNIILPDINHNNIPDYLDASIINDPYKIRKYVPEIITLLTEKDSDNDGLSNLLEKKIGTDPYNRDSDNDKVSDAIEIGLDINNPQDSDHDNKIDALDPDDDNDGVLTKNEDINKDGTPINDDTDNDGIPNYLDANDDGDSRLTINEGSLLDSDKDGILDYLDHNGTSETILTKMDAIKSEKITATKVTATKEPKIVKLPEITPVINTTSETDQNNELSIAELSIKETITASNKSISKPIKEQEKNNSLMSWLTSLLPN